MGRASCPPHFIVLVLWIAALLAKQREADANHDPNVALGGTLYQVLDDQNPNAIKHDYFPTYGFERDHLAHDVALTRGSRPRHWYEKDRIPVNSMHHQGIKTLAPSLLASAVAPDGLIEAAESTNDHFLVGVQWHPEVLELTGRLPTPSTSLATHRSEMPTFFSLLVCIVALGLTAHGRITAVAAQSSAALAMTIVSQPLVEYLPNESGAAIQRGDFQSVRIRRNDLPAVQVLARLRAVIRCTVRLQSRGSELVLLSDDNGAVSAIHQLLAAEPPRPVEL